MVLLRTLGSLFFLCGVLNFSCFGKEVCHLANGFEIEALSHTQDDKRVVLQTATGSLEFSASDVASFEVIPDHSNASHSITPTDSLSAERALQNAANAEGLPAAFVRSVARAESGYNQNAISPKGAVGLMQLMPATATSLGVSPAVLEENAQGGAKYLRDLLIRYKGNAVLALAAYNAGPGAVSKYGGLPPYGETRKYVERVLREYARQQKSTAAPNPAKFNAR